MKYFYLLVLLTGLSQAAQQQQQQQQPGPVYRSAPTILNAVPQGKAVSQPLPTAEERESQVYVNPQDASQPVAPSGGVVGGQKVPSKTQDQTYQVYYYPPAGSQYIQPQTGQVYTPVGYQGGVAVPPPVPAQEISSNFLSNVRTQDVLVGLLVLGLVGSGSALLYPKLVGIKARAMRELSELKSEDAARMARSVMRAIQKYSELNNAKQE